MAERDANSTRRSLFLLQVKKIASTLHPGPIHCVVQVIILSGERLAPLAKWHNKE